MYQQDKEGVINNLLILKGVIIGIFLLLIISTIMALFSSLIYSLESNILNIVLIVENIIIIGYIGFYIARRVDKNGWLNGGLGGLIYMVIIILLGSISMPISFWYIFLMLVTALLIGSIGGMLGINF